MSRQDYLWWEAINHALMENRFFGFGEVQFYALWASALWWGKEDKGSL